MVVVEGLIKRFPAWQKSREGAEEATVTAVAGVSFVVPGGKLFTLLGPSGCGKTTALRCIAGLEQPDGGAIRIGSETVFSSGERIFVPANRRKIGMVFQSYAVWPHLTVLQNVEYPLRMQGVPRAERQERAKRAIEAVGLRGLEHRPAPYLSGGQQQRVALARALVAEPEVLLLDEPLSNLDARLREEMRWELKELQSRLGITTLYVTHDQEEALALSDLVGVMNQGQLVEVGTPEQIYRSPRSPFAAEFVGVVNRLGGRVVEAEDGAGMTVETSIGLLASHARDDIPLSRGDRVHVYIRPEDVIRSSREWQGPNVVQGRVAQSSYLGAWVDARVEVGEGATLRVRLSGREAVRKGEVLHFQIPAEAVHVLPDASHRDVRALTWADNPVGSTNRRMSSA